MLGPRFARKFGLLLTKVARSLSFMTPKFGKLGESAPARLEKGAGLLFPELVLDPGPPLSQGLGICWLILCT